MRFSTAVAAIAALSVASAQTQYTFYGYADDVGDFYINGVAVGSTSGWTDRLLTTFTPLQGQNVFGCRVRDTAASQYGCFWWVVDNQGAVVARSLRSNSKCAAGTTTATAWYQNPGSDAGLTTAVNGPNAGYLNTAFRNSNPLSIGSEIIWAAGTPSHSTVRCRTVVEFNLDACQMPLSEWLETEFSPELLVADTGFKTGTVDVFQFAFDYHRKYGNRYFNTGASDAAETESVTPMTKLTDPADPDAACWDHVTLQLAWGDLVPHCSRDDTSDPQFLIYTCKVMATGNEILDPIRGTVLSRIVHNEIPVQVLFPRQVSASVSNLSAFVPPNVLAAIVRQEVNVDVSDLSNLVAKVRLYTSVQYPFMLDTPAWPAAATPAGISPGLAPTNVQQCDIAALPAGPDAVGTPADSLACNQIWELDLDVAGGANPATSVCELDGAYKFSWQASCQPKFPSDCPLVADDLGQIQNLFAIDFTLDSEYFCPQVVDSVDVSASLAVFKDLTHSVAATNFILGQTAYLVATVSSNKVTVVGAQLDDLSYNRGAGVVADVVDKVELALGAANLQNLVILNSGTTAGNGNVVPANQVWISFLVSNPPFIPAVDGSEDFSISVTLDVQFKDATMLLAAPTSRQLGAEAKAAVSASDDTDTSSSGKLTLSFVGAASAVIAAL